MTMSLSSDKHVRRIIREANNNWVCIKIAFKSMNDEMSREDVNDVYMTQVGICLMSLFWSFHLSKHQNARGPK